MYPPLLARHFPEVVALSEISVGLLEIYEDREVLRGNGVETITPSFDDSQNAFALEYLLMTGTATT